MLIILKPCGRFVGDYVGSNCLWPLKDVSWLGAHWQLVSVVKDHMGLQGDERCTNVVPINEVQEVSSEENVKFFDGMEEGGPSRSGRGEEDIHERMNYVPCMKRMEWCGRKYEYEMVNHVGKMIIEGRIVACDLKELVLDDDLGEINVGVTILNYPNDRSQIMSIWRWPLLETILDGHFLSSLLIAYDEHHVLEDDE
jgi:hypothetical protein